MALMSRKEVAVLVGWPFASQSELFTSFQKSLIDWKKPALQKPTFLDM